jgi:hypothetical protein
LDTEIRTILSIGDGWGFNWEEKVDGVWKSQSIGSVPIGALTMIQKMQREEVDIWEIISFIKRSKSKK